MKEGKVNALAFWFELDMCPGVVLCNGPNSPRTHWEQSMYSIPTELQVNPGDVIEFQIGHDCQSITQLQLIGTSPQVRASPRFSADEGNFRQLRALEEKINGISSLCPPGVPEPLYFEGLRRSLWEMAKDAPWEGLDAETISNNILRLTDFMKGFCIPEKSPIFLPVL